MKKDKPKLREIQKQLTLEMIRQSAREVFYSRPFDEVTIDDIAASAGVSRATVYLHFANKNEILLAVLVENLKDQLTIYQALADLQDRSLESLRAWLQSFRDQLDKHRPVQYLLPIAFMLIPEVAKIITDHREQAIAILGEQIAGFSLAKLTKVEKQTKRVRIYLFIFQLEQVAGNFSVAPGSPEIELGLDALAQQLLDLCTAG